MLCPNCNQDFSSKFCPGCGYCALPDVPSSPARPAPATTTAAAPPPAYQPPPVIIHNYVGAASNRTYSPKNRWIALLLCIFLGWLGVHRFYVGKIGTGIVYLFTCGFFGIGIIIDGLMILFGAFTDKAGNFLYSGNEP